MEADMETDMVTDMAVDTVTDMVTLLVTDMDIEIDTMATMGIEDVMGIMMTTQGDDMVLEVAVTEIDTETDMGIGTAVVLAIIIYNIYEITDRF